MVKVNILNPDFIPERRYPARILSAIDSISFSHADGFSGVVIIVRHCGSGRSSKRGVHLARLGKSFVHPWKIVVWVVGRIM